jgi:hypothetical protein
MEYPKGSVVVHKATGQKAVVIGYVTDCNGHMVHVDVGMESEKWHRDSVALLSAPEDSDIVQRLARLEARVAMLESR